MESLCEQIDEEDVSHCGCESCEAARKPAPVETPLLAQLIELSEQQTTVDQTQLCTFKNPIASAARDFVETYDGGMDDDVESFFPDDLSISVFLFRKKDGKRLELTGPEPVSQYRPHAHDRYHNAPVDEPWEMALYDWSLSDGGTIGPTFTCNVRFIAGMHFKDANAREQPPEGLTGDEIDEWIENQPEHTTELVLAQLEIFLGEELPDYDDYSDGYAEDAEYEQDPRRMLAMLQSPTFAARWM